MRCPRCGYISFDQVTSCLRCNKDIRKVAEGVAGSVANVTAPNYLAFAQQDAARVRGRSQRGGDAVVGIPDEDFFLGESLEDAALGEEEDVVLAQTSDEEEREIEVDIDFSTPLAASPRESASRFSADKRGKEPAESDSNFDLELELGDLDLGLDKNSGR